MTDDPEQLGSLFGMRQPGLYDRQKQSVARDFKALAPWMNTMSVQAGPQSRNIGGGYLEFYPPWELHNPNPGRTTLELYDKDLQQGEGLENAIAGDAMHLLGAVDPRTGQPVDEHFHGMKQRLIGSLTPDQLAIDRRAYDSAQSRGDHRSFDDWMQDSRGDAYIRGYITPDANDEWRKNEAYTPGQQILLDALSAYVRSGKK